MHVLRVQHSVADYDQWKQAFDSDPIGREKSGVRRYRIMRSADDPSYVMIDLEFDHPAAAEKMHAALKELWNRVTVMRDPQGRIAEIVETKDY